VLRHLLNIAVERGALAGNPLLGRGIKAKVTLRKPHLPEAATLAAICDEIERGSGIGGWGMETADFCRFLMFTGCRKSEAAAGCWTDVDLARGIIRIAGTKTEAATREVPLIPPAPGRSRLSDASLWTSGRSWAAFAIASSWSAGNRAET
jgi:integrase